MYGFSSIQIVSRGRNDDGTKNQRSGPGFFQRVIKTMNNFHDWKGTAGLFSNSEASRETATTELTKGFYSILCFFIFTDFLLFASFFTCRSFLYLSASHAPRCNLYIRATCTLFPFPFRKHLDPEWTKGRFRRTFAYNSCIETLQTTGSRQTHPPVFLPSVLHLHSHALIPLCSTNECWTLKIWDTEVRILKVPGSILILRLILMRLLILSFHPHLDLSRGVVTSIFQT
jgi:hypothetical protein